MRNAIIILTLIFSSFMCYCQSNDLATRNSFTLKLPIDGVHYYQTEIAQSPYILPNNTVQIYPGEKLFIETEVLKNKIITMKSVKEIKYSTKTIVITFTHVDENKVYSRTMLDIENPFRKDLIYEAKMFLMKNNKWVQTNVYPVRSKLSSIEIWPDVIVTMALTGWKLK